MSRSHEICGDFGTVDVHLPLQTARETGRSYLCIWVNVAGASRQVVHFSTLVVAYLWSHRRQTCVRGARLLIAVNGSDVLFQIFVWRVLSHLFTLVWTESSD